MPDAMLDSPGDAMLDQGVVAAQTAPGPMLTIGPVFVGYTPGPNAGMTITPGTLDASGNFVPGAVVYGPYLAAATLVGGSYGLTASTTDPVPSGYASIQPGDLILGVLAPIGLALVGSIGRTALGAADLSITVGPAVFDIASQSQVAEAQTGGYLHILAQATLAADGAPYDLTNGPVVIALTQGQDPGPADWQAGVWLPRTASPGAGLYAVLPLSGLTLPKGAYWAFVQTAGYERRALGIVVFR